MLLNVPYPCMPLSHIVKLIKIFFFQNLQQYIKNCLWYAIKTNTKSIAFPTIGTADCDYPKNEVAQIFMRTVGEFMNKHSSTKLEEISVVIYKDDYESTMVSPGFTLFELQLSEIYRIYFRFPCLY